jgi:TolA-binding protein
MMKPACLLLGLSVFAGATCADPTDPCAGLDGSTLSQCRSTQQTLQQQQQLERLLQQQQERQNQLDQQQREVQQQLESMRLQNESLRKQLEREAANQAAHPVATTAAKAQDLPDSAKAQDLESWKADHPWFGRDYSRTQFAMRYIKKLQKERPDLGERELLDAVSTKVDETFGAKQQ